MGKKDRNNEAAVFSNKLLSARESFQLSEKLQPSLYFLFPGKVFTSLLAGTFGSLERAHQHCITQGHFTKGVHDVETL